MVGTSTVTSPQSAAPDTVDRLTDQPPSDAPLTFTELNRRLSAMLDYDEAPAKSRKLSHIGMLATLLAYLVAVLIQHLPLNESLKLALLVVVLVVEYIGLAVHMLNRRVDFKDLFRPFEELAKQLDHDFPHHFEIRDWLVSQPLYYLEKYASMASFRRERYTQKLPMLAGSVSSLGVIPVLAAVYFQGRQIMEGHHLSWIDWIFGFALALFYFLTWTASLTKSRLEAIDMYLQVAMTDLKSRSASDPIK